MKTDLTQLNKLEIYLREHNIAYDRIDKKGVFEETPHGKYVVQCEQHQIIVSPQDQEWKWSAVCQHGSFGYEKGLLEIRGSIVKCKYGSVHIQGWLTADDVIERIEWAKEDGE